MNRKQLLSTLWIVAVLNYLYCDIMTLMDAHLLRQFLDGTVGGMQVTQQFLFGAAVLMEISMSMVFLSFVLPYKANRIANILAASVTTLAQAASLFAGRPTPYYLFFSTIQIGCTVAVLVLAVHSKEPEPSAAHAS